MDAASVTQQPPTHAIEARTGLDPWLRRELPPPPRPVGLQWLRAVGPGVIVLGLAVGSGEFLLGPAVFVRHGLSLLWVVSVAVFLQTVFNTELMRYTMATGEPVFTGFMRTRPGKAWGGLYAAFFVLQVGWPAWAATSASALFLLGTGRLAESGDADSLYRIGLLTFAACVGALLIGRRISRTLELLNWILVAVTLGSFLVLALLVVPSSTWQAMAAGFVGFDTYSHSFRFLPEGTDFFLLGALVGYAGCGGIVNLTLSNWARDKGYGMGSLAGYIPAATGGRKVDLAHAGFIFEATPRSMQRWRGWWRIVRADQWGVFCIGSLLGMALPALLYVTFIPAGTDIAGPGIAAALASAMGAAGGPLMAVAIGAMSAWILFKTQLDIVEGMTRSVTELLWSASPWVRSWRGGDARAVYYSVLGLLVLWGVVALNLAQPITLLKISANIAGVVLVVASLHVLYINTRLLPPELRPPRWRRAALVCMAVFYGTFAILAARSL